MAEVSRNEACPCGSGLKFKKCCMGKVEERQEKGIKLAVLIGVVGLIFAGLLYYLTAFKVGSAVIAVLVAVVFLWYVLSNVPPPKSGQGNPGGISFGR